MKRIRQLADFPESDALLSSIVGIETDYRFLFAETIRLFIELKIRQ